MNDNVRIVGGALAGALVGGVVAHLLLTDRGRQTLSRLRPALDELAALLQETSVTLEKVGDAVREGRRVTRDIRSSDARLQSR